jgi:hypothetical protein
MSPRKSRTAGHFSFKSTPPLLIGQTRAYRGFQRFRPPFIRTLVRVGIFCPAVGGCATVHHMAMKVTTEAQIEFGRRLGLDLAGKTVGVARAMIEDAIDCQFYGRNDLGQPTPKQIELAGKFGRDISAVSRRVGDAVIDDLMTDLNHQAIASQGLGRDVVVTNKHDPFRQRRVISSITDDGTVFFRGGNGAKAWARSLIRADDQTHARILHLVAGHSKPGPRHLP